MAEPEPEVVPEAAINGDAILAQLDAVIESVNQLEEAGQYPGIRMKIYKIIQAQTQGDHHGAIYNELMCGIHGDVVSLNNPYPGNPEPVTLACGHTFCRNCISNWFVGQRAPPQLAAKCPQCNTHITTPIAQLHKNIMIDSILSRLVPLQAHGGKLRRFRKRAKARTKRRVN